MESSLLEISFYVAFPASIGANPGIMAMWEDEKQRRRQHDQSSQITLPVSQGNDIASISR